MELNIFNMAKKEKLIMVAFGALVCTGKLKALKIDLQKTNFNK